MPAAPRSALTFLLVCLVFGVLVTANSGGYRYGVADQAFYIPAVLRDLDASAFPRDGALIDGQARLLVFDEAAAWLVSRLGVSIPAVFLAGYLVTIAVMVTASWLLGRRFGLGRLASAAFVLALTLRHQVLGTGVNTFEGHFHPRVLAFGLGLGAVASFAGRRLPATLALAALAMLVHPTTGGWFVVWTAVAWTAASSSRGDSREGVLAPLLGLGVLVTGLATWAGLDIHGLERMDSSWTAAFAWKDYLFPTQWPAATWIANTLIVAVIPAGYAWRRRAGVAVEGEAAIVAGCLALVAGFVASLPFAWARVAIVLQLQTSRVLWAAETLAVLYAVWALAEARPAPRQARESPGTRGVPLARRAWALLAVLALLSAGRGWYALVVKRPERTLMRLDLRADQPWTTVMLWARDHTPHASHFLVDPGHAWKYDVSFRVGAERDVYLEEVKDSAISLYSRATAARVMQRTEALGDFAALDELKALSLAREFDLDYLISERPLRLPVEYVHRGFTVYRLR